MALKSVVGGSKRFITPDETITATGMNQGENFDGYLILVDTYTAQDGTIKTPMYFSVGEKVIRLYPAGNLKYAIQDGKFKLGQLTRITRIEDKIVKGRKSTNFEILQDDEDVIDVDAVLNAAYDKSAKLYAERKQAMGGTVTKGMTKNEVKRTNLANKAKLLD